MNSRSINWLADISRSLSASFPTLRPVNSFYLTVRLSQRLLERLPPDIGISLIELLPEMLPLRDPEYSVLSRAAGQNADLSIGYPDLVEHARHSLIEAISAVEEPEYFERVVDFFLWEFAHQLSPEIKRQISDNLPVDLRTRMNLYSGHVEESKVA